MISGVTGYLGTQLAESLGSDYNVLGLVSRDVSQCYGCVDTIQVDLSTLHSVDRLFNSLASKNISPWAFIHCASTFSTLPLDSNRWAETFAVNVFSGWDIALRLIAEAEGRGGRVVFLGSVGHKFGGRESIIDYASSKYLLEYFPKALRDCASSNFLVNTVRVGALPSGASQKMSGISPENSGRADLIPTKNLVNRGEVINLISMLISEDNQSIHNSVLSITGGE